VIEMTTKKQTIDKSVLEEKKADAEAAFNAGLKEDIERFAPTLSLKREFEKTEKLVVKILEWPVAVAFQKEGKAPQSEMTMKVEYQGEERTLWLSAESLRREMLYHFQKVGKDIVNREVAITKRPYMHKEYGDTFSYNVNLLPVMEDPI